MPHVSPLELLPAYRSNLQSVRHCFPVRCMLASVLWVGVGEGTYTCALVRLHARVTDMAVAHSSRGALEEWFGQAGC